MKERLEDLGWIAANLEHLLKEDLFDHEVGAKWMIERFHQEKDEDKKYDELRRLYYGIERVKTMLGEMSYIANGNAGEL